MRRQYFLSIIIAIFILGPFSSSPAAEKRLDESQVKRCDSSAKKLQVVPVERISEGKDFCEVIHTGPPIFCINDWIEAGHSYASYQNPLEAGCIDPYPFRVEEILFWVCATGPVTADMYIDILEANLDDPTCPYPGQGIFTSDIYVLELPGPGNYEVLVPMLEKVCVDGPYFAGVNFPGPVMGLGPITDDTPDGCQDYIWFDVDPLDLVSEVGFPGNIVLYSVGFTAVQNTCDEYPPPLPAIVQPRDTAWYDQTYFSDSLRITVDDTSDGSRIDYTTFEYMDPSGIWYPIGTDHDGTDVWFNTWDSAQVGGDGWSCVWFGDGLEDDYYLIRATMTDSMGRSASDTVTIYYDSLPPVPTIIQPESTGVYCGPIEVIFTVQADHIAEIEATIFNFSLGWPGEEKGADSTYNKGIPSMRQDTMYWWGKNKRGQKVNAGCAPTAAAACLTWWKDHGFPGITGGLSGKGLVNTLASKDYMKTSPSRGTKASKFTSGMDKWLRKRLGPCVFKYPWYENNRKKITFDIFAREIKREDIIVGWGGSGKPSHATTGNSVTAQSSTYDVMDPGTGQKTTYKWPDGGGGTKITHWWIISPKVQPQPPPATPGPPPTEDEEEEDKYRIVWTPDPAETPYNHWYSFEVTVTDSLGHIGRDMFHFELADYVCGDANGDGITDLGDVVYDLNYVFKGGDPPEPMESGDANCDGVVDLGDVVFLVNHLFKEGPYSGCF